MNAASFNPIAMGDSIRFAQERRRGAPLVGYQQFLQENEASIQAEIATLSQTLQEREQGVEKTLADLVQEAEAINVHQPATEAGVKVARSIHEVSLNKEPLNKTLAAKKAELDQREDYQRQVRSQLEEIQAVANSKALGQHPCTETLVDCGQKITDLIADGAQQ
jgi:hypothetical protein